MFCPATSSTSKAIPSSGHRGGGAGGASADGEGEDEFRFVLSDEEFIDLFLEDLELPDLAKRQVMGEEKTQPRRAGYKSSGAAVPAFGPAHDAEQPVAAHRAEAAEAGRDRGHGRTPKELEESGADGDEILALRTELERQGLRARAIPFIDPVDVRYRRFEMVPKPVAQAVMFCLMDVSGSMDEHMKDLAKRFYSLLYLFLNRRYRMSRWSSSAIRTRPRRWTRKPSSTAARPAARSSPPRLRR